jgi:hypothetical protein
LAEAHTHGCKQRERKKKATGGGIHGEDDDDDNCGGRQVGDGRQAGSGRLQTRRRNGGDADASGRRRRYAGRRR